MSVGRVLMKIMMFVALIAGVVSVNSAFALDKGRSVTVRFPAFSLSPGERVSGIKLTTDQGRIHTGCRPNRWECDNKGTSVHCYTLHPTYAIAITGMLPEIIITNLSDDGRQPILQGTVEFIDGSGKEYSRDVSGSDMIVK